MFFEGRVVGYPDRRHLEIACCFVPHPAFTWAYVVRPPTDRLASEKEGTDHETSTMPSYV